MHSIGLRLKAWRESVKLSQKDAATQLRVQPRTYQDYERDLRAPGAESMEAFVRAGINANWLLTGEGPMLLADQAQLASAPKINIDALAAIIEGTLKAAPKASQEAVARQSVQFYVECIEKGLITPEGVGDGNLGNAA